MSPEEKELLEKTYALAEENNQILRGIRRINRWGVAYKVVYWVLIIALSYGAYVYIEPYVGQLVETYKSIMGTADEVQKATNSIKDLGQVMNGVPR
jgi:hypothetical protein